MVTVSTVSHTPAFWPRLLSEVLPAGPSTRTYTSLPGGHFPAKRTVVPANRRPTSTACVSVVSVTAGAAEAATGPASAPKNSAAATTTLRSSINDPLLPS